jgi:hypothetical protein
MTNGSNNPAPDSTTDWSAEPDIAALQAAIDLLKTDPERAMGDLAMLAERGSARSMIQLGWEYSHSKVIAHSNAQAEEWYKRASLLGDREGYYYLGLLYGHQGRRSASISAFEEGAEGGNVPCMYRLGIVYYGIGGGERDVNKARFYWAIASERGHVFARLRLGLLLLRGHCGAKEISKGIRLYLSAFVELVRVTVRAPHSDLLRE